MRQKALEMRKAATLERIEKKLDLLAKALNVDFSKPESVLESETVASVVEPEKLVEPPAKTALEREEIAPEAKTRSRNK